MVLEAAGRKLVAYLENYRDKEAVVYGLTRGGVIVAAAVAEELRLPLDCIVARKITERSSPEIAVGAIAENGKPVFYRRFNPKDFWVEIEAERKLIAQQQKLYRSGCQPNSPEAKIAIVVDDGIATGMTMLAAIRYIKSQRAKQVVVAAPVALYGAEERLGSEANRMVAIENASRFNDYVGRYYTSFRPTQDNEVIDALAKLGSTTAKLQTPESVAD